MAEFMDLVSAEFLEKICASQLEFEGAKAPERFIGVFFDLYRIELFKDGLDLILTKLQDKNLKFEIRITRGWDTNIGCFLTEHKSFYDKTLGKILRKAELKIILRKLSYNVLAHEMAHALEFESGINLGEEFRQAIGLDMKDRQPSMITLKAEIKRLMFEALKSYPPHQFLSELFARYFELLSISRNVCAQGEFSTADVMDFFANTTNFIKNIFNPQIKAKINLKIAATTSEIAKKVSLLEPKQTFQERVESFHGKSQNPQNKLWSKSTRSNSMWQSGWQQYQQQLESSNKEKK
jgi:hypothetical protein